MMYIPAAYREADSSTLVAFMQAHSFATLISVHEGRPVASHLPLAVSAHGDTLTVSGHLARANPHAEILDHGQALAIFSGPHAYISPANYAGQENVPTWNYVAVHATGTPRCIHAADDPAALERLIRDMIAIYEPGYAAQWAQLRERYRAGMLQGIVGFTMTVAGLEGKYKLNQNRSDADQEQVAASLRASSDPAARATGALMPRSRRQRQDP